jgi:hypothetical protein
MLFSNPAPGPAVYKCVATKEMLEWCQYWLCCARRALEEARALLRDTPRKRKNKSAFFEDEARSSALLSAMLSCLRMQHPCYDACAVRYHALLLAQHARTPTPCACMHACEHESLHAGALRVTT